MACRIALLIALAVALPAEAIAPPGRYTFPVDGTVYDTRTKLTWQRVVAASSSTQDVAVRYCTELSLQGTGWRLPNKSELATLVDPTESNPAIDKTAFPNTPSMPFWAANQYPSSGALFWMVDFATGSSDGHPARQLYNVRCVR